MVIKISCGFHWLAKVLRSLLSFWSLFDRMIDSLGESWRASVYGTARILIEALCAIGHSRIEWLGLGFDNWRNTSYYRSETFRRVNIEYVYCLQIEFLYFLSLNFCYNNIELHWLLGRSQWWLCQPPPITTDQKHFGELTWHKILPANKIFLSPLLVFLFQSYWVALVHEEESTMVMSTHFHVVCR